MNRSSLRLPIAQLIALTSLHFIVDAFAGMPSVLLPNIRNNFTLTLTQGVAIIVILDISCNVFQILTGHLRSKSTKPLFMQIGLLLASLVTLIFLVPQSHAFYFLCLIFLLAGVGIAIVHPEALRAVHTIARIPATIATSVFITAGFLGFSSGGYIASILIQRFGATSIAWMALLTIPPILFLHLTKVKLATDDHKNDQDNVSLRDVYPFWIIFLMSLPITVSSTILVRLLPSRLAEIGFDVGFTGKSVLLYGIGSAVGSLVWAQLAHKKGELITTSILMLIGAPLLVLYLANLDSAQAIWLLMISGFFASSTYSFIITMGKKATGLKLGQRMGFLIGGAWGFASLVLLALSKPAEIYGIEKILAAVPLGFACASVIGLALFYKTRKKQILKQLQKP